MGTTRVGEVMTPPLLRRLLKRLGDMEKDYAGEGEAPVSLLDCPPGVSCPAITVATHSDALLMVVDPTPFGFQDFALAYEAFRDTGVPARLRHQSGRHTWQRGRRRKSARLLP